MTRLPAFAVLLMLASQAPSAAHAEQAAAVGASQVRLLAAQPTTTLRGTVQGNADATYTVDARAG